MFSVVNRCYRTSYELTYIATLDPGRLTTSDYMDLSNRRTALVVVSPSHRARRHGDPVDPAVVASARNAKAFMWYAQRTPQDPNTGKTYGASKPMPWPESTRGYLYYHLLPGLPPETASVRFRLLKWPTDDFVRAGKDLKDPQGYPWNIPLTYIARCKIYSPFLQLLMDQGLLSESTLELLMHNGGMNYKHAHSRRKSIVCAFGQPFLLDLSAPQTIVYVSNGENTLVVRPLRRKYYSPGKLPSRVFFLFFFYYFVFFLSILLRACSPCSRAHR